MSSPENSAVRVHKGSKSTASSKVRTQFNTLIKNLESERKRLAAWHDAVPHLRARSEAELRPLGDRYMLRMRELIMLFDAASEHKSIKAKEREKLSDLIGNMSFDLIPEGEDAELDAIFEKHGILDPELDNDPDFLALAEMLGEALGIPNARKVDDNAAAQDGAAPTPRKPTAKEARKAAEELRLQQSLREIFRKLASALHPDRENDPSERERKTALMQRVNAAYAANDLLGLLELQFEVEQIDEAHLAGLGDDRIRQYNKMLAKQVDEVRHDIEELEHYLMFQMQVAPSGKVTPAKLAEALSNEVEQLRDSLAAIERDLQQFQDIKVLKAFLKTYRIQDLPDIFDDSYF